MVRIFFSIVLFIGLLSTSAFAQDTVQTTSKGVMVSGTVFDSASNVPLEYSSVMLVKKDANASDGINTDSLGNFSFSNVSAGDYVLSIFYVGFNKIEREITVATDNLNLGVINMASSNASTTLKEVQIVDFKQLIEQRPDGLVYNAEKDLSAKGATAEQLLRKVPMVTVDLEGNVQLRGSGNIRVFIDGKPSTIVAESIKDALRQIPADNIKSVEVITSPGAKYDAEGAAGVINIVTKKNVMKGISGSVNGELSYNMPREFFNGNGGFNLNYRNNKFGMSLNAGYSRWQMVLLNEAQRTDFEGTSNQSILQQVNDFNGKGDFYWSQISADYQIDSLQSVQAGMSYRPGNWRQNVALQTELNPPSTTGFTNNTDSRNPRQNFSYNASYSKKFKNNPKRTLDILGLYSNSMFTRAYDLERSNKQGGEVTYKERNENNSANNQLSLQADYVHPLKKHKQKLEAGLKYINRDIDSKFELSNWFAGSGNNNFTIDPLRTNRLQYNQQVSAAYAQFNTQLSKSLSMIAGARYEYTYIAGRQNEETSKFSEDYNNVLPNVSFQYMLKNFSRLKLAYNMRIERPSIEFVNPYINYSDQFNISQGNPLLVPERTHNVELGYSTFFGQTSINASTFYRHTGNAIEQLTTVSSDNVSRTTFQNIGINNTLGLDMFTNTTLFQKWMINLNGNLYYKMLQSPALNITNNGLQYSASLYTSYKLTKTISLAGFAMYNGNQITLQGSQDGWYYYFFGLQKDVLKGNGTISFSAENIFNPEIHMTTRYNYQGATYVNQTTYFGRGFKIGFNLKFGKMHFIQKKEIRNDDLKKENSTQQGMGGQ